MSIFNSRIIRQKVSTQMGDFQIATAADAVVAVSFPKSDDFEATCAAWLAANTDAPEASPKFAKEASGRLRAYFQGEVSALEGLPVSLLLPAATRRVLEEVGKIPVGETRAYSEIARSLGYGSLGARFVGSANARNPIPLVIPCHRVIGKDGSLVGYGGNLPLKAWLLEWERQHTTT